MSITAAFVLYAVCWFMTLFVVLPLRNRTQGDAGVVVPGTPASAPADFVVRRKAIITTIAATIIWGILVTVILSGVITVRDLDVMGRMPPLATSPAVTN
jgi:predicted secreted protein